MVEARWIDLGGLEPLDLHATYTGVAAAQEDRSAPILLWGRARQGHISIGASQCATEELNLDQCREQGIPVIQRPLGGGNVWIDEHQPCLFVVLPRAFAPHRHPELFSLCLAPLIDVYRSYGLSAHQVGVQDLWSEGRKILGSGAATIGRSMVFGTSFLLRFDVRRFAGLMHCESENTRQWLIELLETGVTDWLSEGVTPDVAELARRVKGRFEQRMDWRLSDASLSQTEREVIEEAREELSEPLVQEGRRHVPYGIKVNASTFLVERVGEAGCLRLVLRDGRIWRLWHEDSEWAVRLQVLCGCGLGDAELIRTLAMARLDEESAGKVLRDIQALRVNAGE